MVPDSARVLLDDFIPEHGASIRILNNLGCSAKDVRSAIYKVHVAVSGFPGIRSVVTAGNSRIVSKVRVEDGYAASQVIDAARARAEAALAGFSGMSVAVALAWYTDPTEVWEPDTELMVEEADRYAKVH